MLKASDVLPEPGMPPDARLLAGENVEEECEQTGPLPAIALASFLIGIDRLRVKGPSPSAGAARRGARLRVGNGVVIAHG